MTRFRGRQIARRAHATAGTLKKFFMDKITSTFTEPEKVEIERLQALLAKFRHGHHSNKYRSAYETHERLAQVQMHISQKEKEDTKKKQ
jgi:cell division protein FtsL